MRFGIDEIADITGGIVVTPAAPQVVATGVTWDSREVKPGDLYVAMPGDRVDGHDFAPAACDAGAVAVLVSHDLPEEEREKLHAASCGEVLVADTALALVDLARAWRARISGRVVGITGSSGKTTTKNLVRDVLSAGMSVVATRANQNNELGVPRTLLASDADTRAVVVEMGMRGLGQIASLADYVKPDIGLVTNVGTSHIELLGSRDAIAQAKCELFDALPENGIALVNAADDYAAWQAAHARGEAQVQAQGQAQGQGDEEGTGAPLGASRRVVFYDGYGDAAAHARQLGIGPESPFVWADAIRFDEGGHPTFALHAQGFDALGNPDADGQVPCTLRLRGAHNVSNACSAVAVGLTLGMTLDQCAAALAQALPEQGRQQVLASPRGITVVDDSYNANPDSMRASLAMFAALQVPGRRFAVLGDMGELGDFSQEGHKLVGRQVPASGVDFLVTVGPRARTIAREAMVAGMPVKAVVQVEHTSEALDAFARLLQPGDAVLVKASHSMELNRVVEGLMASC